VPLVANASVASGAAEGLAGEGRGPDRLVVGPAGELAGVLPAADAGEEVDAPMSAKVICADVEDGSLVDGGVGVEVAEPGGDVGLMVVEVHRARLSRAQDVHKDAH
jgi:hypothetical protein